MWRSGWARIIRDMNAARRIALTGLFGASTLALAPLASAHDALVATNPANNATVTTAPKSLEMTYTGAIMSIGSQVEVRSPDGNRASVTPKVNGTKVTAPFKASGNGKYTVVWRVTSADGHPISGKFGFTLKGQSSASTSTSAAPSKTSTAAGSAERMTQKASETKGPTTPTTNEPGDNQPWLIAGGVVLALGAIGAGWAIGKKRVKDDPRD